MKIFKHRLGRKTLRERLIEISHVCVQAENRRAVKGFDKVHNRLHERGFARAVVADYAHLFAAFYHRAYLAERLVVSKNEFVKHNRLFHRFALGFERSAERRHVERIGRVDVAYSLDLFEFCLRHSGF